MAWTYQFICHLTIEAVMDIILYPLRRTHTFLLHIEIRVYLRTYLDILFVISWRESRFYTFSNFCWKGLLYVVYI